MKRLMCSLIAVVAVLFCGTVQAESEKLFQLEERITAEMEALIDRTGEVSEEDLNTGRKLLEQGIKEHDKGKHLKAIEFYEKALKIVPIDSVAYYEIAYSYMANGNQEKALDAVLRALALNPKMEGYHIMKASILDNMGMSDDAVAAYRRIIDLNPDSYLAHLNLGITLMRQNSFENAYSEIMRAHEIAPQSPSPFLLLSRIAGIRGESYEEERFLQEFVKVGKNDPRLPEVEKRLQSMNQININIGLDSLAGPGAAIAIVEGGARALWHREKHRKAYPDAKGYFPSFEEELDVIESVLGVWKEQKAKEKSLKNPLYELAEASERAGYLNEYVWYINRGKLGSRAESWLKQNEPRVREFIALAEQAGYSDLVRVKTESQTEGNSSLGFRDLPATILKAADASKLIYRVNSGNPEDGARFRKKEADRYKDVFKGAGNQCVNTKEARETLIKASGSLLSNPILDAMRVFKPGEEEWDLAVRKISGLGSRYRDLAPPQSVSGSVEKKGDRIEIQTVAKDWLIYYMAKALWRYEPGFRQRFGGASDDKVTLAEENFAFASLAGARLNARESKDKSAEANPYLDSITEIYGANANIGFLLMEVLHKTYGVSLQCLSPNLLDALRNYHSTFALEPIKSAAD